jgi:hypothetical protein
MPNQFGGYFLLIFNVLRKTVIAQPAQSFKSLTISVNRSGSVFDDGPLRQGSKTTNPFVAFNITEVSTVGTVGCRASTLTIS